MAQTAIDSGLNCSFCAKSQHNVLKLVAGPGVYICNECIDLCNQIIAEELKPKAVPTRQAEVVDRIRRPAHAQVVGRAVR